MLSKTGAFKIPFRNINHYQTLGIHQNSTSKEIKSRFRELSKECHPDKFPDDPLKEAKFKRLNDAYQVLGDKTAKDVYDKSILTGGGNSGGGPIRSARDYAKYKRESGDLHNEYSSVNDPPFTTGDFKNPKRGNKYGFEHETRFGNDDKSEQSDRKWEYRNYENSKEENSKYQTFDSKQQFDEFEKTHSRKTPESKNNRVHSSEKIVAFGVLLFLLTILGKSNRDEAIRNSYGNQETTGIFGHFGTQTTGFGHRDPSRPGIGVPRSDYAGQAERRKMSLYQETVRMEKLKKEVAEQRKILESEKTRENDKSSGKKD